MANTKKNKGTIAILTGGGDVPGLNPAIRAITIRAIREGYRVIGIRRGWGGMIDIVRDKKHDNSKNGNTRTMYHTVDTYKYLKFIYDRLLLDDVDLDYCLCYDVYSIRVSIMIDTT